MPGVCEVELIFRLLDDPDDIRTVRERRHEGGCVSAAEEVGDPFEVIQLDGLIGKEDHKVIGQGFTQLVKLLTFRHLGEVDAGDDGAKRTS